MEVLLS
ncbi:hypothetical protein E2C01_079499 [Portunus trituberculatus]|nr:hypothetical protein [Portunus trituberculatus]